MIVFENEKTARNQAMLHKVPRKYHHYVYIYSKNFRFDDKTFPGGPYFVICQFVEPHRKKVRAFYDEINLSLLL